MGHINAEKIAPIKVLVIPAWYSHKDKNAGIFIHEFCEQMNSDRINISLLYLNYYSIRETLNYLFGKRPKFSFSYKVITANLLILKSKLLFFLGNQFILDYYYKRVLREIRKTGIKFDVLHVQSLCNNVTPYLVKKLSSEFNVSYIVTEHYTSYELSKGNVFKPYLDEQFIKEIAKQAHKRIGVSSYAAEIFNKYFNCKFDVISNIINEQFFAAGKQLTKSEAFTFISIGKLDARKGSLEILKAFDKFHKEHINSKLVFVGNGLLETEIREFIKLNGLENSVHLHTWLDKNEIVSMLDAAHVLISASDLETFGLTIAEAHLRGLPVIATKSGGPDELINERNGLLIEKDNKEVNLYIAIKHMFQKYALFDTIQIKHEAQKKFDKNKIINSYYTIYNDCKNKLLN